MLTTRSQLSLRGFFTVPLLSIALSGCLSGSGSSSAPTNPVSFVVQTEQGPVQGVDENGLLSFKGIPYAAPPIGDMRFSAPIPAADRGNAVLVADRFGPDCPQNPGLFEQGPFSEDCLFLNVYTPDLNGSHPVMVWIHGGAFETGSGGAAYNPERLVENGVTVVTLNYRLGLLGFMAHADLSAESGESGNYGLMDQQAALAWVRANIAEFGGDAENITIFGESAGGHAVLSHLVSPASATLFDKAIIQSGSYMPAQRSLQQAETLGAEVAALAGCEADTANCLRSLSPEDILQAQQDAKASGGPLNFGLIPISFLPATDTDTLPQSIQSALASGQFNAKPVLIGSNLDEWRFYVGVAQLRGIPVNELTYSALIQASTGADSATADLLAAAYPPETYGGVPYALSALGTDAVFACNSLQQTRQIAEHVTTFAYEFSDRNAPPLLPEVPDFDYGAAHAFELTYLFADRDLLTELSATLTGEQLALAQAMIDYWTAFAKNHNGELSVENSPLWPEFIPSSGEQLLNLSPDDLNELSAALFDTTHRCSEIWLAQ